MSNFGRRMEHEDLKKQQPNQEKQTMSKSIVVDGVEYVRKDSIIPPAGKGNRYAVVIDRGWIFAGDCEEFEKNGRWILRMTRMVWLFNWREIGFDGVLDNPFDQRFKRKEMLHRVIELPLPVSEIFRVPVEDNWGIASESEQVE